MLMFQKIFQIITEMRLLRLVLDHQSFYHDAEKRIVLERELDFVRVFKKQIMRGIYLVNDHDDQNKNCYYL